MVFGNQWIHWEINTNSKTFGNQGEHHGSYG